MRSEKLLVVPAMMLSMSLTPLCSYGQSNPESMEPPAPAVSEASLRKGKILFLQCQACHGLKADQGHRVGPNLSGLFGRSAGSAEGFGYSQALQESAIVWDRQQISEFITSPSAKVPGTVMAFAGVAEQANRDAIIDYLQVETQP